MCLGSSASFLCPMGQLGGMVAYLAYPFADLLGHLMLESVRAETAIVGEDLGTVPEGLRGELDAARILSYRVLRFERDGEGFLPPGSYPSLAAACVATHDLPPLAGWWEGKDLNEAAGLGLLSDRDMATATRASEKFALMDAVTRQGYLGPNTGL